MWTRYFLIGLLFFLPLAQSHIIHWNAESRDHTLVAFGLSDYDQDFAKMAIESNLSMAMILLPITGDLEADFTALCAMVNKTVHPVGLVDASWPEMEHYNGLRNFPTPRQSHVTHLTEYTIDVTEMGGRWTQMKQSLDTNVAVRCYRRQLLVTLSSRLQLPLIVLTDPRECPGSMIDTAVDWPTSVGQKTNTEYPYHRLSNPHSPALVHSIAPSGELLSELLKHLTVLNEESWKGFAIIYEHEEDFIKYRSSLESLQTKVLIRCWEKNSFFKAQILREIAHLQAFFLDLSNEHIEQFFQMMGNQAADTQYAKYYIFNHGPLKPLVNVLRNVRGKLVMIRFQLPGVGRPMSKQSKIIQSEIGYTHSESTSRDLLAYGVELIDIQGENTRKYADWNMKRGFVYTQDEQSDSSQRTKSQFENKTFIVTTIEDPPFVIYEPFRQGKEMVGNDQWTGFAIELLKHLSEMHHFSYFIKPVDDRKFGAFDESKGRWDGMIGELIYKKAHLAVASLTITYDRERVIDFTTPFMSLSLSVIIRKSTHDPGLQFTAPLSREVWLSVLIAYLVVSLTLFLLGRVTPHEWYPRHPCNPQVENHFTLLNSFWFTVGSLMQQGCDISPRATSTRIIGTIWWFFILIMVSSYTANLAAFLTIDRMETDIENVEDLTRQTKIKYGALYGGSTYSFFKHSDIPTYHRMWEFMNSNKSLFINKTEDGIQRVLDGNYAFILESTLNEYYSQRNCLLAPLGGLLDPRGYGIGLPIGNNGLRDLLSEGILKLQKDQTLEKMRQYWLQRYNATVPCYLQNAKSALPSRNKLTMSKMSSAFIGLGAGLLLGLVVWVGEMCYWLYKLRRQPNRRAFREISTNLGRVLYGSCRYDNSTRRHSMDETLMDPDQKKTYAEMCAMNGTEQPQHSINNTSTTLHKVTTL